MANGRLILFRHVDGQERFRDSGKRTDVDVCNGVIPLQARMVIRVDGLLDA